MTQIIPAIITESKGGVEKKMDAVRGVAEWVQVDVMDGIFVPPKTWPYTTGSPGDIAEIKGNLKVEAHLMVARPELVLADWIHSGIDRILVHYESTKELGVISDTLKGSSVEFGIALKLDTPIEAIDPFMSECTTVQLMAIAEIGYHGRPFEESVIPKLQALRLKYPELTIQLDGGITVERAMRLASFGADGVVVGGAIFNTNNPGASLKEFKENVDTVSK